MEFLPEKNNINKFIFALFLMINSIFILGFSVLETYFVKIVIVLVLTAVNIYVVYYLLLISTLKYVVTPTHLIIEGIYGLKKIKVKWSDVRNYQTSITLLKKKFFYLLRSDTYAFGKVYDKENDKTELFITSSKKTLYIRTNVGNYGISPAEIEKFTKELNDRNIEESSSKGMGNYTLIDEIGHRESVNILIYTLVLTFISTLLPFVLNWLGLLPKTIHASLPFEAEHHMQYYTYYLDNILTIASVITLTAVMFFLFLKILLIVEEKYYYKLLFLPLTLAVLFLLYQINILMMIIYM